MALHNAAQIDALLYIRLITARRPSPPLGNEAALWWKEVTFDI
jgi:hypothetical protein